MAHAEPDGDTRTFTGVCDGTLAADARGSGGFGYDPAFLPADVPDGRTMAELSDAEKDAISHRGRAARELLAWLRSGERGS
jgi:XTP/dITP diphosphohydrolase